jgi:hypothetical protein
MRAAGLATRPSKTIKTVIIHQIPPQPIFLTKTPQWLIFTFFRRLLDRNDKAQKRTL